MPWTCHHCGAQNEPSEEAIHLISGRMTRTCSECGGKGRENAVGRAIREFERDTGCICAIEVDQSHNPDLEEAATGTLSGAREGVCAVLTADWIARMKAEATVALASDSFAYHVGNDMHQIAADSEALDRQLASHQKLSAQAEEARKAYVAANGSMNNPAPDASAEVKAKFDKAVLMMRIENDRYGAEIERGGGGNPGRQLGRARAMATVQDNVEIVLREGGDGCFHLRLIESGGSGGHSIGMRVSAGGCQMMDPNTGEWHCGDAVLLGALFKAHVERFYERYDQIKFWYYP